MKPLNTDFQIRYRCAVLGGLLIAAFLSIGVGCDQPSSSNGPNAGRSPAPVTEPFPDLSQPRTIGPGIDFYEIHIGGSGGGRPMTLNLYLPAGRHEAKSLPCVFIAPAGTGNHGSIIDDTDRAEHYPYVRAGFAVMAYELSGAIADPKKQSQTYDELIGPIKEFMAAEGGLANGRLAIDYVLQKVQAVNPEQLFACGHSSAADIALNLARGDSRIRACCAYAPVTDVESWWRDAEMERYIPGYTVFATSRSPLKHVDGFKCPVYLFHADDDSMVPLDDNVNFSAAMKAAGKHITFDRVATGDHYQSMIDEGVPRGIKYMISLGAKPIPSIATKAR
jgi:acetyl esterase/lipase